MEALGTQGIGSLAPPPEALTLAACVNDYPALLSPIWLLQRHFLETARGELSYLTCGPENGAPVLCVHGWLDNAASFIPVFNAAAQANLPIRFIAIDLCGHGHSYHLPQGMSYGVWEYLPDIKALIDHLSLSQVMMLGHSLGAGLSTVFTAALGKQIKSLLLVESIAPLVASANDFAAELGHSLVQHAKSRRPARTYKSLDAAVKARASGKYPLGEAHARLLVSQAVQPVEGGVQWRHDSRLVLPSPVRLTEPQVISCIQSIHQPVRLIRGDQGIEINNLAQRLKTFKQVTTYTLQGNHHLHMQSGPAEQLANMLGQWLDPVAKLS